ncbi:MAG: hypothetical protein ACK2UA_18675, partial [Anaerolineae bacterium]
MPLRCLRVQPAPGGDAVAVAYHRIFRPARTIADLAGSEKIEMAHCRGDPVLAKEE